MEKGVRFAVRPSKYLFIFFKKIMIIIIIERRIIGEDDSHGRTKKATFPFRDERRINLLVHVLFILVLAVARH